MTTNRREFLKIAGASALTLVTPSLLSPLWARETVRIPGQDFTPVKALMAKRWAMVIDASKCPLIAPTASPPAIQCIMSRTSGTPKMKSNGSGPNLLPLCSPTKIIPTGSRACKKMRLPVLCNHCENPPCVRVCPTKATFRRPDGIVMMDYHRCIGCRLCMAACPYGARSMNFRDPRPFITKINPDFPTRTKGVVEKCNFCAERLAQGKLPACVLACRQNAILFGDLNDSTSDIRKLIGKRFNLRRKAHLGTAPQIYYIL